jgi:hypothetical protein
LRVLETEEEVERHIRIIHEGSGTSEEATAAAGHRGMTNTIKMLTVRFYWRTIEADVKDYIRTCDRCQKVTFYIILELC